MRYFYYINYIDDIIYIIEITPIISLHVYYAEHEASVGIDGELRAYNLPVKQLKLE